MQGWAAVFTHFLKYKLMNRTVQRQISLGSGWGILCGLTAAQWPALPGAVEVTLMHSEAPAAGSGCLGSQTEVTLAAWGFRGFFFPSTPRDRIN